MSGYQCSVILAAHGSMAHESSNQPLFDLASKVEEAGLFSLVTPAFLNGQPQVTTVLDGLPDGDVIVIPVMTSEGYYSQTVFPRELAENSNLERFRIFMTPSLGVHTDIAQMVCGRLDIIMPLCHLPVEDTTIALIGHGTRQNPNSGTSTYALAEKMLERSPDLKIKVAFLDQDPEIGGLAKSIDTKHTLIIPFLISRGPHSTVDVPEAFGLPTGPDIEFPLVQYEEERITVCDLPVGMYPEMSELCIELATDQMLDSHPIDMTALKRSSGQ